MAWSNTWHMGYGHPTIMWNFSGFLTMGYNGYINPDEWENDRPLL